MTIVEQIANWANADKPGWWKYAIRKSIASGKLTSTDLEHILIVAKMEYRIQDQQENFADLISDVAPIGFGIEEKSTVIKSIKNVSCVSALAPNTSLDFSSNGLTIVYGNNGAGKSSYAKIFKNACLTRGETPSISPNIFTLETGTPTATIEIMSGDDQREFKWQAGGPPIPELKSVRVFDSYSSVHYLTKSGVVDYKPPALCILDELKEAVDYVKERISAEKQQYSQQLVLPERKSGTNASSFMPTADTTIEQVEALCASQEELDSLINLNESYQELLSSSPQELRKKYHQEIKILTPLIEYITSIERLLNDVKIGDVSKLFDESKTKKYLSTQLASETFSNLSLKGVGSQEWVIMWRSVEGFVSSLGSELNFPPKEGDPCPTCLQEVSLDAETRLSAFENYVKSDIQTQATQAEHDYTRVVKVIAALQFSLVEYQAALDLVCRVDPNECDVLEQLLNQYRSRAEMVKSNAFGEPILPIDTSPLTRLKEMVLLLEGHLEATKDDVMLSQRAGELLHQIDTIKDKDIIRLHKEAIINAVARIKKLEAYRRLEASTNTSSITTLNTKISKAGTTGQISKFFKEELKLLGFSNLAVEANIKGSKVNQVMTLNMPGVGKLIDIASEGEQKCISLAGFLAELKADNRNSGIVFDDPVNSLDHDWRLKFAKRIARESESRQVVVLTHDVVFLWMLQNECSTHHTIALTRTKYVTGIPQESPPWDAEKTQARIGKIKNKLPNLKKLYETSNEEFVESAKNLYGKMREAWERLIEEWLIRGVVQRFGREIKPTSIRYLEDITQNDVALIGQALEKCNTYFTGHDTSPEIGSSYPEYEEVKADVIEMEEYFIRLKKRRNN